jgi:hypothetical protein
MVWFFSRGNDSVRVETRFDNTSREFVLDVTWPGRPPETERFNDLGVFQSRVLAVEAQLEAESFAQVGTPKVLPHGWRGPFTS